MIVLDKTLYRYVPMFGESEYDPSQAYSSSDINEQYEALIELQNEGKIRHFALSNETPYGVMRFSEAGESSILQAKHYKINLKNNYCCHRESFMKNT